MFNKISELTNILQTNEVQIAAITETWLTSDIESYELDIPNFTIYRKDRVISRGGGVILFVSSECPSRPVDFLPDTVPGLEITGCTISTIEGALHIIA